MTFKLNDRSERNLKGVHADLIKVVRLAVLKSPIQFIVTQGLRTEHEQRNLVMSGKSQTMNSRHLTGHAVDVAAIIKNNVSWQWGYYEQIAKAFKDAAKELNINIEWGGDWKTLKDGVHFQLTHRDYPA